MNNKIKRNTIQRIVGFIALVAVIGFVMTGCGPQPGGEVNTDALSAKITEAETAKTGVLVDTDAENVPLGRKWVLQSAMTAFENAINAATSVRDAAATQSAVDAAVSVLDRAINTFIAAQSSGRAASMNYGNLEAKIAEAQNAKLNVETAADGSAVAQGFNWVTAQDMNNFNTAITNAQNALTSTNQATVNSAVTALNAAIATFNGAKQNGTKSSGFFQEELTALITQANTAKTGITTSADGGKDISPLASYVDQSALTAFENAISAAGNPGGDIDSAYTALAAAITAFNGARKQGAPTTSVKEDLFEILRDIIAKKDDIVVAANKDQVREGDDWATAAQMAALDAAYEAAYAVYGNGNATVNQVDAATSTLKAAYYAFETAVEQNGPGTLTGRTITISGFPTANNGDDVWIALVYNLPFDSIAEGRGEIINGSVTISLYEAEDGNSGGDPDPEPVPFIGSGSYWVVLGLDVYYLYTNGQAIPDPMSNAPRLAFTNAVTTAAFSQFKEIVPGAGGHQITITGIPAEWNGADAAVNLFDGDLEWIAGSWGTTVSNGTLTVLLVGEDEFSGWNPTGTQQYWVELDMQKESGTEVVYVDFIYTNGRTLEQLGIEEWEDITKAPQFSFSGSSSSIPFNRFAEMSSGSYGSGGDGTTIYINGVSGISGPVSIELQNESMGQYQYGQGTINGGTLTAQIGNWNGYGSYQITVQTSFDGYYMFNNGVPITDWSQVEQAAMYNFTTGGLTLNWSDFVLLPDTAFEGSIITVNGVPGQYNGDWGGIELQTAGSYSGGQGNGEIVNGVLNAGIWYWDGNGSYQIMLELGRDYYYYTGGQALTDPDNAPEYNFTNSGLSLNFNDFREYEYTLPSSTFTISGMPYISGGGVDDNEFIVYLQSGSDSISGNGQIAANGTGTVTINFWDGSGQYRIEVIMDGTSAYVYTEGASLSSLGIYDYNDLDKLPTYNFQPGASIAWNQFMKLDFGGPGGSSTFTISGMPYINGGSADDNMFFVNLQSGGSGTGGGFGGDGQIAANGTGTVTVDGWDGSGQYAIFVHTNNGGSYLYTGGQPLSSFGIYNWEDAYNNPPTYNGFQQGITASIPWNQFAELDFHPGPGTGFPPQSFTQLLPGQWAEGNITAGGEVWYSFSVLYNTTYYFWTNDQFGGDGSKTADIYFNAWYADSEWVVEGDDCWYVPAEYFSASNSGTIYIKVQCWDNDSGSYAIAYTTDKSRPGSVTLSGTVNSPSKAGTYILALTSSVSSLDDLYDESFFDLVVSQTETFEESWSMFFTPPISATLWFLVVDWDTGDVHITDSALSTSSTVALNTGSADMTYLGNMDDGGRRSGVPSLPGKQAVKSGGLLRN